MSETRNFLLSLADIASERQTPQLTRLAHDVVSDAKVVLPSVEKVNEIYRDFELIAPAQAAGCFANILNAGWRGFHDDHLWSGIPQIRERRSVLKELLLKSIEVFEYEEIVRSP